MKLLFDNNLSVKLPRIVADTFPESKHVIELGMDESEDADIWKYAAKNGFTIVTKDTDFYHLSAVYSFPPKVIWLLVGNCRNRVIYDLIQQYTDVISDFIENGTEGMLILEKDTGVT